MKISILSELGTQLREARKARRLTQPALAARLGRDPARISELERDLLKERLGRDRLALLVEICDTLDLVPLLVPRTRAATIRESMAPVSAPARAPGGDHSTAFDDVFIDLADEDESE